MAQLLIRNVDDNVRDSLRRRAARHGLSMEEELRDILRTAAAAEDATPPAGLGTRISAMFAEFGLQEGELEELPDAPVRLVTFEP